MTQIATTSTGATAKSGAMALHAKGSHTAKGDAALDFAALVAGLDVSTDAADANPLSTKDADTKGSDKNGAKDKRGKGSDSIILDLSLAAAAQNGAAPPVVTPQVGTSPVGAVAEDAPATRGEAGVATVNIASVSKDTSVRLPVGTEAVATAPATTARPTLVAQAAPINADTVISASRYDAPVRPEALDAAPSPRTAAKTAATTPRQGDMPTIRQNKRDEAQPKIDSATIPVSSSPPPADPISVTRGQPAVAASELAEGTVSESKHVAAETAPLVSEATAPQPNVRGAAARQTRTATTAARLDEKVQTSAPVPARASQSQTGEQGKDSSAQDQGNPASALPASSTGQDAPIPTRDSFADIVQSLPPITQSRVGIAADSTVSTVQASTNIGTALSGQVIDMSVGGQWIDRMAQEITALAKGDGHSRFQLSPPSLGRIQVDVWQGQEGGRLQVLTETDEAAKRLKDGQPSLEADARLASLSLTSISIDKAPGAFGPGNDQSNQNGGQNPAPRHQQTSTDLGAQTGGSGPNDGSRGQNPSSQQPGAQTGEQQGGNNGSQAKNPGRRDVLNHQQDTQVQQGMAARADGDRLVRYA